MDGERLPSITQMLTISGHSDDTWYTQESADRGTAIHQAATRFDLGALELADVPEGHRGSVSAYIAASRALRPVWELIEVAMVDPTWTWCGRPDRIGRVLGSRACLEIKSGAPEPSHSLQLALQAILVAGQGGLPAELYARYGLYLKASGRFKLERFTSLRDYDVARDVIRRCT
jgi:hypothetical protein